MLNGIRCLRAFGGFTLLMAMACLPNRAHALSTLERLCVLIKQNSTVQYQCQLPQLSSSTASLPLQLSYQTTLDATFVGQASWTIKNTSAARLDGLNVLVVADVDLDAASDTFFNEFAELIDLTPPASELGASTWEVDELGYRAGSLWQRANAASLRNQTVLDSTRADDAATALGFAPMNLEAGDSMIVNVRSGPGLNTGIRFSNVGNSSRHDLAASLKINAVGTPPQVAITSPAANQTMIVGTPFVITASAASANANGQIAGVEFLVNGALIAQHRFP
jgi:hypothetical protein